MVYINEYSFMKVKNSVLSRRMLAGLLMLVAAAGLSACSNKDKKPGQSLVRVNGEEITILQVNDEFMRAGVQAGQEEAASKKLLESLIDRQLILAEAVRNKIDRTPEVMQAIERAKAQIIAQAFLQKITSQIAKPSKAEVDEYFEKHPEFFTKRKEFYLQQLAVANRNFSDEIKVFIDSARSLDEVAIWMDRHGVNYVRGQVTRSTADLPQQAVDKLLELPQGQLFLVSEGDNKVLNILTAIKDAPVTATNAVPQIERFLANKKGKDAVEVEIAHLRSLAKIEYLNASAPAATQVPVAASDNKMAGAVADN